MNNLLISNPFLFRPDSPLSSQEISRKDEYFTDFNINFIASQFNEAWENSSPVKTESNSSPHYSLWSVSSPTISSTSESSDLEDLFPMEDSWASSSTINLADLNVEASEIITADSPGEEHKILDNLNLTLDCLDDYPLDLYSIDFKAVFEGLEDKSVDIMDIKKEQCLLFDQNKGLPSLTMPFHNNRLQLEAEKTNIFPSGAENETTVASMTQMNTRGGHKRKEALEHRMVAPSPRAAVEEEQIETKPDIQALGINNGQQRVGMKRRSSSISSKDGPSSSTGKAKPDKKPRKYELDDANDSSVRNAKAAKMNRDRKKKEAEERRNEIHKLKNENSTLKTALTESKEEATNFKNLYFQEKQKNVMSEGLQKNITNVKKIFEAIITPLNRAFGPMEVEIPDGFADIPARVAADGTVETFPGAGFNILDESYQMPMEGCSSNYTTFHISPEDRKIRLDYNPIVESSGGDGGLCSKC